VDRDRLRRLRWRLRGAWLWPAFVVLTVVEGVLLGQLPLAGDGTAFIPGVLLAGFFNLVAVAALMPLLGRRVRRLRPDLPKVVADDYAGTALVVAVFAVLLTVGLIHRPERLAAERDYKAQSAAVVRWVAARGAPEFRHNVSRADTWQQAEDLYRTCVPGPDPKRSLCLIVDTSESPPSVTRDGSAAPNSEFVGPDAIGHR
jgi:hypothetical protein